MNRVFGIAVLSGVLAFPVVAQAQGVVRGSERGAAEGGADAGPLGAIVGGVVGGVAGGVAGVFGVDDRPRFHDYVVHQHPSSFTYPGELRVGTVLPDGGYEYYPVPPDYRVDPAYRYTVINHETVVVDPRTHRIVEVIPD